MANKKRIFVVALALCILTIFSYGSLAWYTAADKAENVFELGMVEIEQHEYQRNDAGQLVPFENNKMLLPVLGDDPTAANDYYQEKIVVVENVGQTDAYLQTLVAVPKVLDDSGVLKIHDASGASYWNKLDGDPVLDGIQPIYTATFEGVVYNVYCYRYREALTPSQQFTQPCMEYVYIDKRADMNFYDTDNDGQKDTAYFVMDGIELSGFNAAGEVNVLVASQAIQTGSFTDPDTALDGKFENPWS